MFRSILALVLVLAMAPALADAPPLADNRTFSDRNGQPLTFDQFVDKWLANAGLLVTHSCLVGNATRTCLFVPWFRDSSHCGASDLKNDCSHPGTPTLSHFCVVTDEFSQVGLVLAMRGDGTRFAQWVNTVRRILRTAPKVPLWRFRVDLSGPVAAFDFASAGDDDASDATARIILALYIAAGSSSRFQAPERLEYRILADEMSRGFVFDFKDEGVPVRNPITQQNETIRYWLASGQNTAKRVSAFCPNCTDAFSFGGYHGDAVIALLAAKRGAIAANDTYEQMAVDTARHYLRASTFNNTGFRVPPMKYNLDLDGTDLSSVCVQCPSCNSAYAWDSSDAVRAVSLCKARYHASTAGVALPLELDDYCNTWVSTGFFLQGNEQYVRSYTLAGAHCLIGAGYEEYSLGSYLRFHYSPQRYSDYIGMAVNQFDSLSTPTRFGTSSDPNYCAGIYFPAFVAVSFGSGTGRDAAFARPALDMLALTAAASSATSIDVAWTDVMASSFRVQRSTNGTAWTDRGTTSGRSFTDGADPGSAYLYRVQALDGAQNVIGTSNSDLVTTFVISPAVSGNNVQAADFNARITAINKVREMAGLTPIAPVGQGQTIAAGHVQSMRAALEEVRGQFGLAPVSYRQLPVVAAASVIHTWEMNEIGEGLR